MGYYGLARPNGLASYLEVYADGEIVLRSRYEDKEVSQSLGHLNGSQAAQTVLDFMNALAHLPPSNMTYE